MRNYMMKKAEVITKILCAMICVIFLFSDAKMIYLSFNGNGELGFCVGILNLTIVHFLFLGVLLYALRGCFASYYIITVGSFLSCNASYYATVRQAAFDSRTLPIQSFLYLLPFLFWLLYLLGKAKGKMLQKKFLCSAVAQYPYFVVSALYLLALPLIPKNEYFLYFIIINYFVLLVLTAAQLHRNAHPRFQTRRI